MQTVKPVKRGAIYYRISSGDQSEYSLPSQKRLCREKMEKDEVKEVCGPFEDEESGFKDTKRDGFSKLMHHVLAGELDYVYVANLDRLGRHCVETPYLMHKLKQMGVIVRDLYEEYNFDDPIQYLIVAIKCYRAHAESVRIGDRSKQGKIEKIKEGKWVGPPPFGYRKNAEESLEKIPGMEAIIYDCFQTYAHTGDCKKTAEEITRKYASKIGVLKPDKLGRILRNTAYIGRLKWGEIKVDRPHLRMIPDELWNAVQDKMKTTSKHRKAKRKKKPYSIWDDWAIEYGKDYVVCMLKEVKPICPKCGSIMKGNGNKKVLGIFVPNFLCPNEKCKYEKTIPAATELACILKDHVSCPVCRTTDYYDKFEALDGSVKYCCKRCGTVFQFSRKSDEKITDTIHCCSSFKIGKQNEKLKSSIRNSQPESEIEENKVSEEEGAGGGMNENLGKQSSINDFIGESDD